MQRDDLELLAAYVRDGDESAFAELVGRHDRWIHAAARRRLQDEHLADDATQAVFIVVASKASELIEAKRGSLSAWLFHVMHFTCARLRRSETRRLKLERAAETGRDTDDRAEPLVDAPLILLLEESIAQLPAREREMIVRRFYRRENFTTLGAAMNLSAEAARKRVSRALAEVEQRMLRIGADEIPDAFLEKLNKTNKPALSRGRISLIIKETDAMKAQTPPPAGGHQMISAEFLVKDVEANLTFFEKLGFPRRFIDTPDASGRIPRASLTAGKMGKIWIRRADESEIRPSPSINIFFWLDGGPDALVAHRQKLADGGVVVSAIIDEHGLPNFNVTTPDGYSIAFFTQYVPAGAPPIVLVQ